MKLDRLLKLFFLCEQYCSRILRAEEGSWKPMFYFILKRLKVVVEIQYMVTGGCVGIFLFFDVSPKRVFVVLGKRVK